MRRFSWIATIGVAAVLCSVVPLYEGAARADDSEQNRAFRAYLSFPFGPGSGKKKTRLGFQMLSELTPTTYAAYGLTSFDGELTTMMDLAFTRGGLADFKVFGVDARKAYFAFEQAYRTSGGSFGGAFVIMSSGAGSVTWCKTAECLGEADGDGPAAGEVVEASVQ